MTLTFDLTHDLDLGCFIVKFLNSCISGSKLRWVPTKKLVSGDFPESLVK